MAINTRQTRSRGQSACPGSCLDRRQKYKLSNDFEKSEGPATAPDGTDGNLGPRPLERARGWLGPA